MRKIKGLKRGAARRAVVASVVLAASVGTFERSAIGGEGGGFLPRLGSSAVGDNDHAGNAGFAGFATNFNDGESANGGVSDGRVESAGFIDIAGDSDVAGSGGAAAGRARLVAWDSSGEKTSDASGTSGPSGTSGKGGATQTKTPILREETATTPSGGSFFGALVSTVGSLAVVLGAFFALVALWKRTSPQSGNGGAAEVVDSSPLGDRARLLTIRWGNRLILAARTPEKIAPLAEIADPAEVAETLAEIERRKSAAASRFSGRFGEAVGGRLDAGELWKAAFGAKGWKR